MRPEYNKPLIGRKIEPYGEVFYANPYAMSWAERRELITMAFGISQDNPIQGLDTSETILLKVLKGFNNVVDPVTGQALKKPETVEELRALPGLLVEAMLEQSQRIVQQEIEPPKERLKK